MISKYDEQQLWHRQRIRRQRKYHETKRIIKRRRAQHPITHFITVLQDGCVKQTKGR
jgi:hypothetical protein